MKLVLAAAFLLTKATAFSSTAFGARSASHVSATNQAEDLELTRKVRILCSYFSFYSRHYRGQTHPTEVVCCDVQLTRHTNDFLIDVYGT